jgi:hypothetical protein
MQLRLELQVLHHTVSMFMNLGRVVKTLLLGDLEITDSKAYLDTCVENYRRALSDIVVIRTIIKVEEIVKGTLPCFECEVDCQQGWLH